MPPTSNLSVGRHVLLDAWKIDIARLDDPGFVRRALERAVDACEGTLLDMIVHRFEPHGVTATAVLAESHLAVHTWPEHGYLGADLFYCGRGEPQRAMASLAESFRAGEVRFRHLDRGLGTASDPSGWMQHGP